MWPKGFLGIALGAIVLAACGSSSPAVNTSAQRVIAETGRPCGHRVLILSALPLELSPLVAEAAIKPADTVHTNGRTFYVGRLAGNDVVLALTGIGPVNAEQTSTAAFEYFRCSFAATVFSGVAGSSANIGDVVVPQRWTLNNARTQIGTDAAMLATARKLQGAAHVKLRRDLPLGDAACLCSGVDPTIQVHLPQKPQVRVGGNGMTTDPFGGHAVPCVMGGGDISGCEPCAISLKSAADAANVAKSAPSLADPHSVEARPQPSEGATLSVTVSDEETAAVDQVAHRYGVPFLGIRAVSDGQGDPLHLPGFPSEFFVYRQLAGNNAAVVTIAFLGTWAANGNPTARNPRGASASSA
jgi:nucleoside phosphorylase